MLENPSGTQIIQTQPLKSADLTIHHRISNKIKRKKLLKNSEKIKRLDYTNLQALAKRSTFWVFWLESDDVNLKKIAIFCCLNCIFECINGFNMLKNPGGTWIIQTQPLKYADRTIPHQILGKFKWQKSSENFQKVERLDYTLFI